MIMGNSVLKIIIASQGNAVRGHAPNVGTTEISGPTRSAFLAKHVQISLGIRTPVPNIINADQDHVTCSFVEIPRMQRRSSNATKQEIDLSLSAAGVMRVS
jgi:hypothetical protein